MTNTLSYAIISTTVPNKKSSVERIFCRFCLGANCERSKTKTTKIPYVKPPTKTKCEKQMPL